MPEQSDSKQLNWENGKEWGEIYCPMTGRNEMTYWPGGPCYYTYTAPLLSEDGDAYCCQFDHDEALWIDDYISLYDADEMDENTKFYM